MNKFFYLNNCILPSTRNEYNLHSLKPLLDYLLEIPSTTYQTDTKILNLHKTRFPFLLSYHTNVLMLDLQN